MAGFSKEELPLYRTLKMTSTHESQIRDYKCSEHTEGPQRRGGHQERRRKGGGVKPLIC